MPKVSSSSSDPCDEQLRLFTACVKSFPQGLKESDCEDSKEVFKKCMKEWKEKRHSGSLV